MDQASQEELQRILTTPEAELTLEDKRFIHARRGYLTKSQLNDYADIINEVHAMNTKSNDTAKTVHEVTEPQQPKPQKAAKQKPQQPAQDNDVRLNLNVPEKSEKQLAAEAAMAEAKRLQEEAEAESANASTPSNTTEDQEEQEECLDPDCVNPEHAHTTD
jgi:hypothetical protein